MDIEQIKPIIELTAEKAVNRAVKETLKIVREERDKDLELHTANCSVRKYRMFTAFIIAVVTGVIVSISSCAINNANNTRIHQREQKTAKAQPSSQRVGGSPVAQE